MPNKPKVGRMRALLPAGAADGRQGRRSYGYEWLAICSFVHLINAAQLDRRMRAAHAHGLKRWQVTG
jgi:hypothetical protein